MTQKELADAAGYAAHTMIVKIEKGLVDIPITKINALAEALDVNPTDLLSDPENQKTPTHIVVDERDQRLIEWFRSLPPEKQKAILLSQDAPEGLV